MNRTDSSDGVTEPAAALLVDLGSQQVTELPEVGYASLTRAR